MNVEAWHLEVASGRRRGPASAVTRGLLAIAAGGYGLGVAWRNRRFDRGTSASHAAPLPVVSVGNLTAGGTGKTPVTAWLAERLRAAGHRPGILMRGYKAAAGGKNDEQRLLEELLGEQVVVEADRDRVAAACRLAGNDAATVLLLDDGYQHRRLRRDVNLLIIDGMRPFGFGHLLPRGLLREPLKAMQRADAIVVTRRELIDSTDADEITRQVRRWSSVPLFFAKFEAKPELTGRRVLVCSAIGHPAAFRRTVEDLGGSIAGVRVFPDHHEFTLAEIADIERQALREGAEIVVTAKDWVKLKLSTKMPDGYVVIRQRVEIDEPDLLLRLIGERIEARQAALASD